MSEQIEEVEITARGETKPKKQLSEQQLLNLKKARERAQERKTELKNLHAKSKALKEEQLKLDALEYDKLHDVVTARQSQKNEEELKKLKQKELDEIVNQQQEKQNKIDETKKKKKIKKIIYEDSSEDEEVETVVIRKKKEITQAQAQPRQPNFNDLANMSIQNQIHKKLNEEKFNSLYAQLVNCRY